MSRVRNADEFLRRFREIRSAYEDRHARRIAQIRQMYAGEPEQALLDNSLEAHARTYVVNALLAALNWRLDIGPDHGLPNLVPEAPIRSEQRGSVRFLDYLGLERETGSPLLVVETKRPNAQLPRTSQPVDTYPAAVSRGLAGDPLTGEWNTWLPALRDYIRSVDDRARKAPRRVVITNGDWLIIFLDPTAAFLEEASSPDFGSILVYKDRNDIERRFGEVFRHLEHQHVLGETPPLTPGELLFHLSPEAIGRAVHGLHLRYIKQRKVYENAPVIVVAPVVFLRSRYGAWFRVESPPKDYELSPRNTRVSRHLTDVRRAAKVLLSAVKGQLGRSMKPLPISMHYDSEDGFETLRGVTECGKDEFLVITGDKTHYLLPKPSVPNCPFHDWLRANVAGCASNPGPVIGRSVEPRSFFVSSEPHHCAHRDVNLAKASPITAANKDRCGPRSGQEGRSFCEIWCFEQHLCCRTCTFEEVCTKAAVFRLPCSRPEA